MTPFQIIALVAGPIISAICALVLLQIKSEIGGLKIWFLEKLGDHERECAATYVRRDELPALERRAT